MLNDISRREGPLSLTMDTGAGSAGSSSLDEFAPFRLSDRWLGGLPTVNPSAGGASGGGASSSLSATASPVAWQDGVRTAVHHLDRWSRQAGLLLKRNANVRVYGLVYLAVLHVYFLYSLLRLFV